MPVRRLHRRLVAWCLAFCVVFAQSAALAYGCDRAASALDQRAEVPCPLHKNAAVPDEEPVAVPNVCEVHCAAVSLPDAPVLDVPALVAVVAWPLPLVAALPVDATAPAGLAPRIASPPVRTLYARLLI